MSNPDDSEGGRPIGREGEGNSYDRVPYTSYPYVRTHPDRLATVGRLFGMTPAPVERCRVLELGCGSGGNLIAMAEALPGSEHVGIDLSATQIDQGRAAIETLGLRNVTLHHGDLQQVDAGWGSYDYVICHGVYSWVPRAVQDAIMRTLAARLRPQGIAYLSYNTYPGWHLREAVRHMVRYHGAQFEDPTQRTEQARALVDFLAGATDPQQAWGQLLRRELDLLARTGADYVFHEHLEEDNTPLYFHELVERARAEGLQYLGEADVHMMLARTLPAEVADTLGRISPDIVRLEQYLDFVHNRQFRATLLCHEAVTLSRALSAERLRGQWLGLCAQDDGTPVDLSPDVPHTFRLPAGIEVTTTLPITKAALQRLRRAWPDLIGFEALVEHATRLLREGGLPAPEPDVAAQTLGNDLLDLLVRGGLELHCMRPAIVTTVGERPRVSPYARYQAQHGRFVTTRRHMRLDLDAIAAAIVQRLDGEHDRAALVDALLTEIRQGRLAFEETAPGEHDQALHRALVAAVDRTLAALAGHGLLVG